MVGLNLKYDLLKTFKPKVIVAIIQLVSALFLLALPENSSMNILLTFNSLFMVSYVASTVTMFVMTFVFFFSRFSKTLYSDQGYLTHTLPVSKWSLLLSKYLMNLIYGAADIILFICTIAILSSFQLDLSWLFYDFGITVLVALLIFISYLFFITTFAFCKSISHIAHKNNKLIAVGVYLAVTYGSSIVLSIVLSFFQVINFEILFAAADVAGYVYGILGTCIVFYGVLTALGIFIINYCLNKKLNLS